MKSSHHSEKINDPVIFSRAALELTFRLLRNKSPALALEIQNVLASGKVPGLYGGSRTTDHFYVDLEARSVGKIVAALTEMGQKALADSSGKSGQRIVIRTLIHEWMRLAEWIIMQAQEEFTAVLQ